MLSDTGKAKFDMVKVILEQSQKITKLENKIQKNKSERKSSGLKRELSTKILRSYDSENSHLETEVDYGFDGYRQKSQKTDRVGQDDLKLSIKYQPKLTTKK